MQETMFEQFIPSIYSIAFLFGLLVGSFLNCCIYRIPRGISLRNPRRSFCPNCKSNIPFYRNIPVLSFMLLGGKCSNCRTKISLHYLFVELFCGCFYALSLYWFGITLQALAVMAVGSILLVISIIDWQFFRIPNVLVVIAGIILILQGMFEENLTSRFLAGLFAGLLLIAIRLVGNQWLKRESMGLGDVKLGIVMGMALGIPGFLFALFIGSAAGLLFALLINLVGITGSKEELPFGTFLAVSTILLLLIGAPVLAFF